MSAQTYTVESTERTRDWDGKFGPMRSYFLKLHGRDGTVELSQKVDTPPPTVGQVIEGTLEPNGDYPPKLKRVQQQNNFGGGGPRPEDPKRAARIVRQHSQSAAIELASLAFAMGVLPKQPDVKTLWVEVIKPMTDVLDKDATGAGE